MNSFIGYANIHNTGSFKVVNFEHHGMRRYLTAVTTKTLRNDRSFRINVSTGASLCAAITSYNGTMLSRTFKMLLMRTSKSTVALVTK